MKTLVLDVRSLSQTLAEVADAVEREIPQSDARFSFATPELLWKTLTANRWGLLRALTGAGPVGVRELARRVGRDVKAVHADAQALVLAGLVEKSSDGKLHFPYDAIHVDFLLKAA